MNPSFKQYTPLKIFYIQPNITAQRTEDDLLRKIDDYCYFGVNPKQLAKVVNKIQNNKISHVTVNINGNIR